MVSLPSPRDSVARFLGFPLVGKIMGANAMILIITSAIIGGLIGRRVRIEPFELAIALGPSVATMFLLNYWLIVTALRPIHRVEEVTRRVAEGDFTARVEPSLLDDRAMRQLGSTINILLTALTTERVHLHQTAARVVDRADRERAQLARELLDSTAQNLAALAMQLEAMSREDVASRPAQNPSFVAARDLATETLSELRAMALAVYPTVLDDLGLAAALRHFASRVSVDTGTPVTVQVLDPDDDLSRPERGALYRVAEEAVLVATQMTPITLTLRREGLWLSLQITSDDSAGTPLIAGASDLPSTLLNMRSRLALVGGVLEAEPHDHKPRKLVARVPIQRYPSPEYTLRRNSYV
jgi:signal transduction histidine kinase